MSRATLVPVPAGRDARELRFFIRLDGRHAGGITVHSVCGTSFSYGIAVAREMRRRGAAHGALLQLYEQMKERGFSRAFVQVEASNRASLALHEKLGFVETGRAGGVATLEKRL